MTDFLMPSLGADMESAQVVEWLVQPGDEVRSGDIIVVVETDKGAIDVEVFDHGVIDALVAPVDAVVPVGGVLARIRPSAAARATIPPPAEPRAPAPAPAPVAAPVAVAVAARVTPARASDAVRRRASPAARTRAAALGLDLADIPGHGPQGAITLADVAAAQTARGDAARRRPAGFEPAAMRRAIGSAMLRAKREIPHYYLEQTLDFGAAQEWLAATNAARPVASRLLPAVVLLRASALALSRIAGFNGTFVDDAFVPAARVHAGWAVALRGGGLVAPALHDAHARSIDDLMVGLNDLVKRARGGGLRSSELMDATVTITSLGDRGADVVLPIIHPPQVAMLGFGRIASRPWVVDGVVVARPLVHATVAADHRVSDGHAGGLLLAEIERLLGNPEAL